MCPPIHRRDDRRQDWRKRSYLAIPDDEEGDYNNSEIDDRACCEGGEEFEEDESSEGDEEGDFDAFSACVDVRALGPEESEVLAFVPRSRRNLQRETGAAKVRLPVFPWTTGSRKVPRGCGPPGRIKRIARQRALRPPIAATSADHVQRHLAARFDDRQRRAGRGRSEELK